MTHELDDAQLPIADTANQRHLRVVADDEPDEQDIEPRSIYHPDHDLHYFLAHARPDDLEAIDELLADAQVRAEFQLDEYAPNTRALLENLLIVELACNRGSRETFDMLHRAAPLMDRMERTAIAVSARAMVTPVVAAALPELSPTEVATLVRDCTDGPDASWLGLEI